MFINRKVEGEGVSKTHCESREFFTFFIIINFVKNIVLNIIKKNEQENVWFKTMTNYKP